MAGDRFLDFNVENREAAGSMPRALFGENGVRVVWPSAVSGSVVTTS